MQYQLGADFSSPLNPCVRAAGIILAYLLGVFLLAALAAPWVWQLGQWAAAEIPAFKPLGAQPFHRYLNRCLLVIALAGLWPVARAFQLSSRRALGLAGEPAAKRRLGLGAALGLGSLLVVALAMIAAKVGALPGRSADRFLHLAAGGTVRSKYQPAGTTSLEGLTWPDTYYVTPTEDEAVILRRIVDRYDAEVARLGIPTRAAAKGESVYTATITASLIQGEAGVDSDRPLISAVIANRLAQGMPLQIDATVLYAIGHRKASNTAADRAVDSPYNTYRVRGLPPTPIATVTKASLLAALHPASTTYLYYVLAAADGHHAFASTYAERLRNVEAARRAGLLK